MKDKKDRKEESKSLLSKIMSFGARDKAAKAKPAAYISEDKKRNFKLKK